VIKGVGLGDSRALDAFVLDVRLGDADLTTLWQGIQFDKYKLLGARCSVVVKALFYKPERRGSQTRWGEHLILPVALGPGVIQRLTEMST
jgi:hypothetical protein